MLEIWGNGPPLATSMSLSYDHVRLGKKRLRTAVGVPIASVAAPLEEACDVLSQVF